jgi:hypothetical protein
MPRTCEHRDPAIACRERVQAVRTGDLWWSADDRTWYWLRETTERDAPVLRLSRMATCPWCGRPLPDLGGPPPQADGFVGEEGG